LQEEGTLSSSARIKDTIFSKNVPLDKKRKMLIIRSEVRSSVREKLKIRPRGR